MKLKNNLVIINGRKFFYWEKNRKNKQVIVLLHGFPGNHMGLVDLANYLDNEYRIIIPDLPACGQSESLNGIHNLKSYSNWLNSFLESLSINKTIIIGHSFGSRVALVFAANYAKNVEKLVLITPVVEVDGFIARVATLYYKIAEVLPNYLQKIMLSNGFGKKMGDIIIFKPANPKIHKKIIDRDVKELKKLNQKVIIEIFNEFYKFKLIALGKRIKTESLVIASDKDEIATLKSVKILAGNIDKVSFEIMENSGHLVPLEKPSATAKIILHFLQDKSPNIIKI